MRLRTPVYKKAVAVRAISIFVAGLILLLAGELLFKYHFTGSPTVLTPSRQFNGPASLVDIAINASMPPLTGKDILYLPLTGKGTFAVPVSTSSSQARASKITDSTILFAALSHDQQTAAYVNSKGVYLYDISSKKSHPLIIGNDYDLYYEEPSWAPDDKSLLVTRKKLSWKVHGFDVLSQEIVEISVGGQMLQKLADGCAGIYTPDKKDVIFERDLQIRIKHLVNGKEEIIDQGRFPALSPDGNYLAYVKRVQNKRFLRANASVIEDIPNVYICSVKNPTDRRKVSSNYVYKYMDEHEWLKQVKDSSIPQELCYTGKYDYFNPAWGGDDNTLYVVKAGSSEKEPMSIMRINLSPQVLVAQDLVARWCEAYINRDDDLASSLMENNEQICTLSNPHPVAFAIIGSGSDRGKTYVDVRMTVAYNADSFYSLGKQRFYLSKREPGYCISRIDKQKSLQLSAKDADIVLENQGLKQVLKTVDGIVSDIPSPTGRRLSALAFQPEKGLYLYTIQQRNRFKTVVMEQGHRQIIAEDTVNAPDPAVMDISFNASGTYAAIRYWDGNNESILMYDVGKKTFFTDTFLRGIQEAMWAGDVLIVTKPLAGDVTLRWEYYPEQKNAQLWQ